MYLILKDVSLQMALSIVTVKWHLNKHFYFNSERLPQDYLSELGSQTAEPQRVAATTTIQTQPSAEDQQQSNATVRKYLGSRSPSGQSPVTKSRKTPQNVTVSTSTKESSDREIGSPKSRTWKGLVARQFRKIQGQPSSPNSHYVTLPDGASIGVPLAQCPMVCVSIFFDCFFDCG